MKKVNAEFHIHTRYSHDSILNYFFILYMCKLKKINLIAITDHNEVVGAQKYKEKLAKHNIEVIVGEEIFTKDGEIIGLYLLEKIEPNLTPSETIHLIKKQGGYVYIPHPYDEKRYKSVLKYDEIIKNKKDIDFIEIHNGRNIEESFSKKQEEISNELTNATKIIGSDAHTFYELGRNIVTFEYRGKEDLKESIKTGKFKKKECIRLAHLNTKIARIITLIEKGEWYELYRIIKRKCKK